MKPHIRDAITQASIEKRRHMVLPGGIHLKGVHNTSRLSQGQLVTITEQVTQEIDFFEKNFLVCPTVNDIDKDVRFATEIARLYNCGLNTTIAGHDPNVWQVILAISCNTTWTSIDALLRQCPEFIRESTIVLSIFDRTKGVRPRHLAPLQYFYFAKSPLETYAAIDCPHPQCNPEAVHEKSPLCPCPV